MIGTALIMTAVLIGLAVFWENIVKWLRKLFEKIQQMIRGVIYGAKVFVRKASNKLQEITYSYTKTPEGKWQEVQAKKDIEESDLPNDIKKKLNMSAECDITDDLAMQLERRS